MRFLKATILVAALMNATASVGAQPILRSEPMVLAPYGVALVQDSSCASGKILKVTGAIRGLRRKKECIPFVGDHLRR